METTKEIQAYKPNKNVLEQKLELAKELNLKEQVSMIHKELKISDIQQKTTYEEVTPQKCRELLCPKTTVKFEARRIWHILPWKWDWEECQFKQLSGLSFMQLMGMGQRAEECQKIVSHENVIHPEIRREVLGTESNVTGMPMAALLLMKEAKEKVQFDSFEIWRPETSAEQQKRLEDPWLVGVIGQRYFKLCDWR